MQNDILPPGNWRNTKKSNRKNFNGLKFDKSRGRLVRSDAHLSELEAAEGYAKAPTLRRTEHWSRKRKVFSTLGLLFLLTVLGTAVFLLFFHKKPVPVVVQQPIAKAQPPPAPQTVASPLTGLQVDPGSAARPVTAIMIENSPDARPQSGLQEAGVVFEAIAEAGITRFMGLYQDARPQWIGPVRSLRPYYIDFAAPFQASIAHVGGSPDALAQVRSGAYRDIDQFFNSGSYWRVSSRVAPHNVYTSFDSLDNLNKSKGYSSSQFTPWTRQPEKPLANKTANHIDIRMSGPLYNSHYDYDYKINSYYRFEGGAPHFQIASADGKNAVQLHPKVVVALVMSYGLLNDGYHSDYAMDGSGQMYIFQDGGVVQAYWSKQGRTNMFQFLDAAGHQVPLDPGQVWVTAVASPGDVTSGP